MARKKIDYTYVSTLLDEGKGSEEIAGIMGISEVSIYNFAKNNNRLDQIKRPKKPKVDLEKVDFFKEQIRLGTFEANAERIADIFFSALSAYIHRA